jgi:hypothetical protein
MNSKKVKKKASEMTDAELLRSLFPAKLRKEAKTVAHEAREKGKRGI